MIQIPKKKKNKAGRPSKRDTIDLQQLERLASLGLTDEQIGFTFGVSEQTINTWKKKANISLALKKGKDVSDRRVERALFERATGYSHPEDKIMQYLGRAVVVETIKHYPPDTLAAIFWLKNRKREDWRDRQQLEHIIKPFLHPEFEGATTADLEKQADELREKRTKGIKAGAGAGVSKEDKSA